MEQEPGGFKFCDEGHQREQEKNNSFSLYSAPGLTTSVNIIFDIDLEGKSPSLYYKGKNSFLQEHFNYEVAMFRFAGNRMDTLIQQRNKSREEKNKLKEREYNTAINMALEVFVMHWRALIEFFYKKKHQKDDTRAYMFFSDKTKWGKTCPPKSEFVKKQETRSNKEVAHITSSLKYETDPEKKWPCPEMETELEKIIELFIQAI